MDGFLQLVIELVRPTGNLFAKYVMPKGFIEEDSVASDSMGGFLILSVLILIAYLLIRLFG